MQYVISLTWKFRQQKNNDEEKVTLVQSHSVHLKNAELAWKALQDEILASKNQDKYFAFSVDLHKTLPYPKLFVSIAYYKGNMYLLNKGFYKFHDNKVNMYVWDETTASRGSQKIASCCQTFTKCNESKSCYCIQWYVYRAKSKFTNGINVVESCPVFGK